MQKEGRKKQARSNKQQGKGTQHTQGSHSQKNELPWVGYMYIYFWNWVAVSRGVQYPGCGMDCRRSRVRIAWRLAGLNCVQHLVNRDRD